jgi:hypothetical protein
MPPTSAGIPGHARIRIVDLLIKEASTRGMLWVLVDGRKGEKIHFD